MFTEAEQVIIEQFRGINSKLAYNNLARIYTKHTGEKVAGCGCKAQQRQVFLNKFYEWQEKNS